MARSGLTDLCLGTDAKMIIIYPTEQDTRIFSVIEERANIHEINLDSHQDVASEVVSRLILSA